MTAGVGHNSGDGAIAVKELELLVERIERINDEIKNSQDDRKDVYAEAKSRGYDPATIRSIIQIRAARAKNLDAYNEKQALLDTYLAAFGIE